MYTQCPECDTLYRVSSDDLRQAAGQVECGQCGAHFNALETLSERPAPRRNGARGAAVPGREPGPGAALEEALEEAPEPAAPGAPAGPADAVPEELAPRQEPVVEEEPAPEEAPATTEGSVTGAEPVLSAEPEEDATEPDDEVDRLAPGEDEPTIVEGEEGPRFEDTRTDIWDTGEWRMASPAVFPVLDEEADDPRWAKGLETLAGEPPAGEAEPGETGPETDAEPPVTQEPAAAPSELAAERRRRWPAWLFAGLLVVLTALVLVHARRGELARDPETAEWLGRVYGALGMTLRPAWSVSALRVIDSSVNLTGDGLAVQVAFVNEAPYPQPYPVLRVTLQDRWNQPLATQDLSPSEYLTGFVSGRRMRPGEEARGRAVLRSPGSEAVGFSVDLCLEAPDGALRCRASGG